MKPKILWHFPICGALLSYRQTPKAQMHPWKQDTSKQTHKEWHPVAATIPLEETIKDLQSGLTKEDGIAMVSPTSYDPPLHLLLCNPATKQIQIVRSINSIHDQTNNDTNENPDTHLTYLSKYHHLLPSHIRARADRKLPKEKFQTKAWAKP